MLSNVNADKDQVLQVILIGQAQLRDTLRRPELEQFAQRIAVDYHLESLNRQETHEYIYHRIKIARGDGPAIFDAAACDAIYDHSRGVPRLINLLCDTALVYGFAERKREINGRTVEEVARDKKKGGIFPGGKDSGNFGSVILGSGTPALSRREAAERSTSDPPRPPKQLEEHEHYAREIEQIYRAVDAEVGRGREKGRK